VAVPAGLEPATP